MKDSHDGLPVPSNVDIFGCCGLLKRPHDESEDELPDCCPSLESVEDDKYLLVCFFDDDLFILLEVTLLTFWVTVLSSFLDLYLPLDLLLDSFDLPLLSSSSFISCFQADIVVLRKNHRNMNHL
jgi:hypothetical protein